MRTLTLTTPALHVLQACDLPLEVLDRTFDRLSRGRKDLVICPGHPHFVRARSRSPMVPSMLVRRRRHLLMQLEGRHPFWRYRELASYDCDLIFEGEPSATVVNAAPGMLLGAFVGEASLLAQVPIIAMSGRSGLGIASLSPERIRVDIRRRR